MQLPLDLPIAPMLAKAVADVPAADGIEGGWTYEPEWDGFRCIACRDGEDVELLSRSRKLLNRYFLEVVQLVREHLPGRCILDGELVVLVGEPGAQRSTGSPSAPGSTLRPPGSSGSARRRRPSGSASTCWPWATRT